MRHLWLIFFAGLMGGSYAYLHQGPAGGSSARGFHWAMLWAQESDLPPSERLAPYLGKFLEPVLSPLDAPVKGAPPVGEIVELGHRFRAEGSSAPAARRPIYVAAIEICRALLQVIEERKEALSALAQETSQPTRDPFTGRLRGRSSFFADRVRSTWEQERARQWAAIRQAYALLQARERAAGWLGGADYEPTRNP